MFSLTGYATVWEVSNKGNYSDVKISTSRKETRGEKSKLVGKKSSSGDFWVNSSWTFVRFIGKAHEMIEQAAKGERIKILNASLTNEGYYKDDEKVWPKFPRITVFEFEFVDNGDAGAKIPLVKEDSTSEEDTIPF